MISDNNWETIFTPDVFEDRSLEFKRLPIEYSTEECACKGAIQKIHYKTSVYENGITYDKFAVVYLPYGYEEDNEEKKYNVLYYLHGDGSTPNEQFLHKKAEADGKNIFDNMMAGEKQIVDPFIIICPTYYFDIEEDAAKVKPARGPAGDGLFADIKANFYQEVIKDLIPQVESRFHVYCSDFSEEGIKRSRDHRAFAGYSRGSAYTWHMFHNCLEYFRWFLPMSANCLKTGMTPDDIPWSHEEALNYIKEPLSVHPDLPFFIFASSGSSEDFPIMREQMNYFYQHGGFSFGKDPCQNNFYYTVADYSHSGFYFGYYLANIIDTLSDCGSVSRSFRSLPPRDIKS